jgi:hypothetical protein
MADPAASFDRLRRGCDAATSLAVRALCALALMPVLLSPHQPAAARSAVPPVSLEATPGRLPLAFAPNVGQLDPSVRFQVAGPGAALLFTPSSVVLAIDARGAGEDPPERSVVHMEFAGAGPAPEIVGSGRLPGTLNILRGRDPQAWRTGIPTYAGIVYRQLYPGIELRYEGAGGQLKGSYLLAPGADASRIRWRYQGAAGVQLDVTSGDLIVSLRPAQISLSEKAPRAWQTVGRRQVPVAVRFALAADGSIGFALGSYDRTRPLVIDPLLVYSTYLGGADGDTGTSIAVDQSGDAYVTGMTLSADFPGAGPPQPGFGGGDCGASRCYDAFIAKLGADGQLAYSTYLGGDGWDEGRGIAVDEAGSAVIVGATGSRNFPVHSARQPSYGGHGASPLPFGDGFVARLSVDGQSLVYSTYLGGSYGDWVNGVAVDSAGVAYLTGGTLSADFPTTAAAQPAFGGGICFRQDPCSDGFLARLSADGGTLLYSTYLGGSDEDRADSIAVDRAGNAYVAGVTRSFDFPTRRAIQAAHAGGQYSYDVFVAAYDPSGVQSYSTYLGGSGEDQEPQIAVTSAGGAIVAGQTFSGDFPTRSAVQPGYGGGRCGDAACPDTFLAALAPGGELTYSTYLGGSAGARLAGLMPDADSALIIVATTSPNFPVPLPGSSCSGGRYAALTFAPDGRVARSAAFSLGDASAGVRDIARDSSGALYIVGVIGSAGLPTARPIQARLSGYSDAFVAKIDLQAAPGRPIWPLPSDGAYASQAIRSLWARSDMPVAGGLARRSWVWGPEPVTAGFHERYSDSPDSLRMVQYFDKSRMEVNDLNAAPGPWYVTNGLLVEELIAGSVQVGSQSFEPCQPAEEAIAGDPAAINASAPTYRSFRDWSFPFNQDRAADRRGQIVTAVLARDGSLSESPDLGRYAVTIGLYEQQLGHNIPQVFADFFAQRGVIFVGQRNTIGPVIHDWVYVVGLPLSEPYWVRAKVGGVERDVLVQVFERRVLTYTPDNAVDWRVEMGNVGRHYLSWRYGLAP